MNRIFHLAAAEKGLGFFSLDLKTHTVTWEEETARALGEAAERERAALVRYLSSGLRSYIFKGLALGSKESFRCLVPLNGSVMEAVIPPVDRGSGNQREGYFSTFSLQEPIDMMKKYFISNISNKLRSLLNSVIIASDVMAASDKDTIWQHQKFLSLMAEDAREVNTLLNRMGEVISYTVTGERNAD